MDHKYIRRLRKQQKSAGKKLYAVISLLLVTVLLLTTASYAWLTISRAPEVSEVSTTLGANGNLEIALATAEHLNILQANDMYDPETSVEFATGDPVHDNVLWGNLIDLTATEYGLYALNMRPAVLNILDGYIADAPIMVGKYAADGRMEDFDPEKDAMNLDKIGFAGVYSTELAAYRAGRVTMSMDDLVSGNYDKAALVQSILDSREYGVRIAGTLDYNATVKQEQNSANIDLIVDGYCFAVDLLLRTNAPTANLMLQTEGKQRVESEYEDQYVGGGSFLEMDNEVLRTAIRIVFADTLTGEVYALAQADAQGKLWITARADDSGKLVPTEAEDASLIKPLVQNQVTALTAWVILDGTQVDNSVAAVKEAVSMKLNLQFSTDAVLNPAHTDNPTNPEYPDRPDMPDGPQELGAVSNLRFETVDDRITLVFDYPEGVTKETNLVFYDVHLSDSTTGESFVQQSAVNSLPLTAFSEIVPGVYDTFRVDSQKNYQITASADFADLFLTVLQEDGTAQPLYVRIEPTTATSNYAYTYMLSGLTPNTPFLLYTASEKSAFGTGNGPAYLSVTTGTSDAYGNITGDLWTWDTLMQLKDNPNEQGAQLTKLYYKVVEWTDPTVLEEGQVASFTQNLRSDWTRYIPGGVGEDLPQSDTTWSYNPDGTLIVRGNGPMTGYSAGKYPWSGLGGRVTKLVIEEGVTTVAPSAFEGFIRLQSVDLADSITAIGDYAFWKCAQLQNFALPDNLKSIGTGSFRGCASLTELTVPDTVTELGAMCFAECPALEEVTLSDNLEVIPQGAFGWCGNLKSITTGRALTAINAQAFEACENLADVYAMGGRVRWDTTSISSTGNEALKNATIHWPFIHDGTMSDTISWKLDNSGHLLIAGTGSVSGHPWSVVESEILTLEVSEGITKLEHIAFLDCENMTSASLPSTLTTIGSRVFDGCASLTDLQIPESVCDVAMDAFTGCEQLLETENGITYVDKWAFSSLEDLTEISLREDTVGLARNIFDTREGITSVQIPASVRYMGDSAFSGCANLAQVEFGQGSRLVQIGDFAFSGCSKLQQIALPDGVTHIGRNAFYYCYGLRSVTLSDNLEQIGKSAFSHCSDLQCVEFPASLCSMGEYAFEYCSDMTDVVFAPNSRLTQIPQRAFYQCTGLANLVLPDGLVSIGGEAFSGCDSLVTTQLPDTLEEILGSAFSSCESLKTITIPASVHTLTNNAFGYCRKLETVEFAPGSMLKEIQNYTFQQCSGLLSISLPDGITEIGDSAFYQCSSLVSAKLPDELVSIGEYAFAGCHSLEAIEIPAKVTRIGESALSCGGLKSISVAAGNTKFHSEGNCLIGTSTKSLIRGCVNSVIPADGSVTSIGNAAFSNCAGLETIEIPDTVTVLVDYAFNSCEDLKRLVLPDSVRQIGFAAFAYCTALEELELSKGLVTIDLIAFSNCTALTEITFPVSLKYLGAWSFEYCYKLQTIYYEGTEEQWQQISAGAYWYYSVGSEVGGYTIVYLDE